MRAFRVCVLAAAIVVAFAAGCWFGQTKAPTPELVIRFDAGWRTVGVWRAGELRSEWEPRDRPEWDVLAGLLATDGEGPAAGSLPEAGAGPLIPPDELERYLSQQETHAQDPAYVFKPAPSPAELRKRLKELRAQE